MFVTQNYSAVGNDVDSKIHRYISYQYTLSGKAVSGKSGETGETFYPRNSREFKQSEVENK